MKALVRPRHGPNTINGGEVSSTQVRLSILPCSTSKQLLQGYRYFYDRRVEGMLSGRLNPEALWPHLLGGKTETEVYIQRLSPVAKASYLAKRELLGLSAQEDPYAACNADKFEDDMILWPPLEY